jgi:hypothetical protein
MTTRIDGLSPLCSLRADQVSWDAIVAFWNEIRTSEDIGVATWEDLEALEREVTECRNQEPPDLGRAVSLTFRAQLAIAGLDEL